MNEGSEEDAPNLKWKTFKHSQDPEKKMVVLVSFSDLILNKAAEEQGLLIQLQDKYQNLPFMEAGRTQYQRFRGFESIKLIQSIFKREFNVNTLIEGGVVYEHFMLHTQTRYEIVDSIKRN